MAGFIIRNMLTLAEGDRLIDEARKFFTANRRRRVFRIGDGDTPWFQVRRSHILEDIQAHTNGTLKATK